jgi:hypothetical protein
MKIEKHCKHYYKIWLAGKVFWVAGDNLEPFKKEYPQLLSGKLGIITYE